MSQPDIEGGRLSSRHLVQFFESPDFLAQSVTSYLIEGLEMGHAAVLICRPQHRQLIEQCLAAAGWPVGEKHGATDVRFFDAADTLSQLMPNGALDQRSFDTTIGQIVWQSGRAGRRGVRAYGEMVSLLCERGQFAEAAELEGLWNDLARRHHFWLLCSYRVSQFDREGVAHHFDSICDAHHDVLPSEQWMRLDETAQLRRVADLERQAAQNGRLLAELQEAVKKLAEADRHKDEFLAMLGHELRNPLAPIFTALQLMSLRGDTASSREREVIGRQAIHLTHLVDDLLDVSRVARGKIKLEKQPIELAELTARAVEIASPLFEERRHHLTISVPRQGLVVDADVVRLSQVLANLLGNAAKYTEPGGRVSLTAHRSGSEIVVEVADNGSGIARHLLPIIFDVFVQGDQAIDRAKGGLGLGLALVKNLTQLHGGSVSAHSDGLGAGSKFVLRLPVSSRGTASATTSRAARADAGGSETAVPSQRVLLVDDNEDAAEVLAEVLRMRGCEVTVAHDGPAALALAHTQQHDIALLDLGLPVMDGYELADRLRDGLGSAVPKLIAVTGYGQDSDRARTQQAGFVAHLVKPVALDELFDTIARA